MFRFIHNFRIFNKIYYYQHISQQMYCICYENYNHFLFAIVLILKKKNINILTPSLYTKQNQFQNEMKKKIL